MMHRDMQIGLSNFVLSTTTQKEIQMKRTLSAAIVLGFSTVLATGVFAQGRHDEKPHASAKASAEAVQYAPVAMSGGRHDERPHGPRKPTQVKQESKGGTEAGFKADDCCK